MTPARPPKSECRSPRSTRPRSWSTSTPTSTTSTCMAAHAPRARRCASAATPRPTSARCVALHQIARGAVGVCCQKVSEAEAMVDGGVRNVLVSNEIVDRREDRAARRPGPPGRGRRVRRRPAERRRPRRGGARSRGAPRRAGRDRRRQRPLRRRARRARRRAGPARRGPAEPPLRRSPGLLRARPAHQRRREAAGGDRDRHRATCGTPSISSSGRGSPARSCPARGRELPLGGGERRLQRGPGRLLLLHGRRVQAASRASRASSGSRSSSWPR